MTRTTCILSLTISVLMLVNPTSALHCNGDITRIDVGAATFYLDDRSSEPGDFNHWIYLETNDIHGLQSGGENNVMAGCGSSLLHPCLEDHCMHDNHDLLVF